MILVNFKFKCKAAFVSHKEVAPSMERCRSFPGEAIGAIATKATWYIQSAWLGLVRLALLRLDLVGVLAWFLPLANQKVVVKSDNLTILADRMFLGKSQLRTS